jgi:hypothetical protein
VTAEGSLKTALIDSSSAIILFKADVVDTAADAWSLMAPASVIDELTVVDQPGAKWFDRMAASGRLQPIAPSPPGSNPFRRLDRMGKGERDTLRLYLDGWGDFVLVDDGQAAGFCRKHRIPYTSALLVPRILALAGIALSGGSGAAMERVFRLGRYSDEVLAYARNCPDDHLERFLP